MVSIVDIYLGYEINVLCIFKLINCNLECCWEKVFIYDIKMGLVRVKFLKYFGFRILFFFKKY